MVVSGGVFKFAAGKEYPSSLRSWDRIYLEAMMNWKVTLLELLLAGFFAVACIRARGIISLERKKMLGDFFRLSSRLERLRRSRWQWFCMVLILLVLRMQRQLPVVIEVMVALQFVIFLALPVRAVAKGGR